MASEYEVSGKIAIVTGGAMGLGAALTEELVRQNAKHVTFLDIVEEAGKETEKAITDTYGIGRVTFILCDVADDKQLELAYKRVIEDHGRIDIVVNNAGIFEDHKSLFRKMVDINFSAVVSSTLSAMEHMRSDDGGSGGTIVNVASIAALLTSHLFPIYGATKAAVLHFGSAMGMEPLYSRTKVRVITVCLGATDTRLINVAENRGIWDDRFFPELEAMTSAIRIQSTKDAARAFIEVYKKGKSSSTWIVADGVAKDVTETIKGADFATELYQE